MKPVLLLIDLQRDYLSAAGLEPNAAQIVERAGALLQGCRAGGVPVVHVWTTVSNAHDNRMPHWKRDGKWQCVENTVGHKPPDELAPESAEAIVHKQFFSAFSGGGLATAMAQHGADTILIAGIHLHACIRATVLDAYQRGFNICIVHDAVGSDDPVHAEITRRYLETRAVRFLSVAQLLKFLREGKEHWEPAQPASVQLSEAVSEARSAGTAWSATAVQQRRAILQRLADCVGEHATTLAEQMAASIGKPIFFGTTEVERTAELIRHIASNEFEPSTGARTGFRRVPLGVIAVITPWNNPVLIPLGKIAAALFYGNAVVWKPAPAAVEIAQFIMQFLATAGCPKGVVNLIEGDRACAVRLMSDSDVDAVTLTGGAAAGYTAQEICARHHIPLQAELGGNNAAIVWPDADLSMAATKIAAGAFDQAGQRCTANRRAIVHTDCYDAFIALLERATAALPIGDPLNLQTRVGPLVNSSERARVAALISRAAASGSRTIGPRRLPDELDPSVFQAPVIVCCDNPDHEIVQEETFGPVLVVQRAADWPEAMRLSNAVRQGLVAALFTRSDDIQRRFLDEARAGVLKINQATAEVAVHLPFGGWKASGVGPPEHGAGDREFYTRLQAIYSSPAA